MILCFDKKVKESMPLEFIEGDDCRRRSASFSLTRACWSTMGLEVLSHAGEAAPPPHN